ncbi:hypothetical protein NLJ89_g10441 [Agrocybe chaxingu]|uniref:Aip3p/Bud6 N-terminal domain-containing protein n=1 Tax=Agrocybe chaxingu TaxID=84603 RepID=A0A9W8JQL3_9AGAR|nr:hypothetical protein NLJ89_g10441 [Agrocybe chaxingu]
MSRPPSSSQSNGHSSRRDNQSISSNASSSGRSDRTARQPSPAVESAVTRLLVSIKQLLEALTQWSQLRMDEEGVSNVYVRLGNDFNAAVAAFGQFNIDMSELLSVPDDLRTVLEQCLAEDATTENLEIYLPSVRQIITNLLQGLRGKQSIYRRIVSDHRNRSGEERTERSSRTSGSSRHRSQGSRAQASEDGSEAGGSSRRSVQSSSGRRREHLSQATSQAGSDFVGGFAPTIMEHPTGQSEVEPEFRRSQSNDLVESQRRTERPGPSSLAQTSSSPSFGTPRNDSQDLPTQSRSATPAPEEPPLPASSPPPVPVPASVKRYSLVDKPMDKPSPTLTPTVIVEPSSPYDQNGTASPPPPDTPPIDPPPAVAKSLAALK